MHYAKQKKPNPKGNILYEFIYDILEKPKLYRQKTDE